MKWKKAILEFLGLQEGAVPTEEQLADGFEKAIAERQELKTRCKGLTADKEEFTEKVNNLQDFEDKYNELEPIHEKLQEEHEALNEEVTELKKFTPMAEVGQQYLSDIREKAEADYKLLQQEEGTEPDEEMLDLIRNADIKQAKVYAKNFAAEVQKKIPAICEDCGKPTNASRRSSKEVLDDKIARKDRASYQQG